MMDDAQTKSERGARVCGSKFFQLCRTKLLSVAGYVLCVCVCMCVCVCGLSQVELALDVIINTQTHTHDVLCSVTSFRTEQMQLRVQHDSCVYER